MPQIRISKFPSPIKSILIILCAVFFIRQMLTKTKQQLGDLSSKQIKKPAVTTEDYIRGIIPNMDTITNCDDIFKNSTYEEFFKDTGYLEKRIIFDKKVSDVMRELNSGGPYGHMGESHYHRQQISYFSLARLPFVKTICETGFNAGHSAHICLSANPKVKLISFDLGVHSYTRKMASYLKEQFPGRFELILGSSVETIPKFIKSETRDVRYCDILIVDGGHEREVASQDILNMRKLANPHHNILLIDDYPHNTNIVEAWNDAEKQILLRNYMYCRMPNAPSRKGFLIGGYLF